MPRNAPRRPGSGGARTGTPGQAYPNRTDLTLPVTTAPGQQYGQATAQAQGQAAVPMASGPPAPAAPAPGPAPAGPPPAAPVSAPPIMPGQLPPLDSPTNRPNEHVSTGLPVGGGAGPEAMPMYSGDDTGIQLRSLYAKFPNQDLADLIQVAEANRGS